MVSWPELLLLLLLLLLLIGQLTLPLNGFNWLAAALLLMTSCGTNPL
jgi:hypothetical protein